MSEAVREAVHEAAALLRGADEVAMACHVSPDADALGSMLALGLALRERGARVVASYGDEPFAVPRALGFLPGLDLLVPPAQFPAAPQLMVTLDTSSPERLGLLAAPAQAAGTVVVIDHHVTNARFGTLHVLDAAAAATALLVVELLDALDLPLTREIATAIYAGLVTDTGSFRFAATTAQVHRLAARLLEAGVAHDLVSRELFDTEPLAYLRLLAAALARARLEPDAVAGRGLVWTLVGAAERAAYDVGLDQVEGVVDVLRRTAEAEVAAVLKEDDDGSLKVSTRAKGAVDLAAACGALGGGGHRCAAGFTSYDGPEETLARLRAALG